MRARLRQTAVLAGIAVAAPALAMVGFGCGEDDVSPDTVAQAADRTVEAGGSKVVLTGSIEGEGIPRIPFSGDGAMDAKGQRGELKLRFSKPGGAGGGDKFVIEETFDRQVIYMRSPLLRPGLPGGKEWLKIDLRRATRELGADVGQLGGVGQDNPTNSLRTLRAVSGDVEKLGEEKVRGVSTTGYKATIDLRRYPKLVPARERREAQTAVERLVRLSGTATVPVEVWIDKKGLLRRERLTYSFKSPQGGRLKTRLQLELFDFGTPVDVDTPAPAEVYDATRLAAREIRKQSER